MRNKVKLMRSPKFETTEQALDYALTKPLPRSKRVPWEEVLHEGVEVPIELK